MRLLPAFLFLLLPFQIFCQAKTATVSGKVLDENDNPVANTSVTMLGKKTGTATSENGSFRITVPSHSAFALIFSHTGYRVEQKNFYLSPGEEEIVTITLRVSSGTLDTVVVADTRSRREAGLLRVNPKTAVRIPSTTGGIEAMIKTLVGSNNELTSQYNVRGGNYDENIIYINDFEIYRPYLVSSGQQEGLSFINPEMTRNVNFYTGGFPARYGDKMSSVLDIQYKVPVKFEGAAYLSLLEQGLLRLAAGRERDGWPSTPVLLETGDRQILAQTEGLVDRPSAVVAAIATTINGRACTLSGDAPSKSLLDALREDAGLTGAKEGCAEGECGACTVWLNGQAVMACLTPAGQAHGAQVTTIEGLSASANAAPPAALHPLQAAFIRNAAVQCGFCIPGMLMAGAKLLDEQPHPTREQAQIALSGNICRCTGYRKILDAVLDAADEPNRANVATLGGEV